MSHDLVAIPFPADDDIIPVPSGISTNDARDMYPTMLITDASNIRVTKRRRENMLGKEFAATPKDEVGEFMVWIRQIEQETADVVTPKQGEVLLWGWKNDRNRLLQFYDKAKDGPGIKSPIAMVYVKTLALQQREKQPLVSNV